MQALQQQVAAIRTAAAGLEETLVRSGAGPLLDRFGERLQALLDEFAWEVGSADGAAPYPAGSATGSA